MTGYFPLLRLQFLSRLADLKPRNLKANFQAHKGKTIGMAFAYVFAFGYLGVFLVVFENYMLDAFLAMGMPDMLLSMAVTMAMLSTLVLSFFFIMSSLYFSRDSAFIASLPVTDRTVLAAKLTQIWLSETGISALFILPACILYAIRVGVEPLFFLRMLLVWAGVAVLPIVIVAFLSTLLIRLSFLWKRREIVATVGGIALMVAYMIFCMNMGGMFGDATEGGDMLTQFLTSNQARIEAMTRIFPPAAWAAKGLLGDWSQLVLFLAVCAGAMALAIWLIGYIYRDLSLLQSETPTEKKKLLRRTEGSYQGGSAFRACVSREIRQILRVPAYATNSLPTVFMPVLMTVFFTVSMNRAVGSEGEGAMFLDGLGGGMIVAVAAAIMAFMSGINPALATAVSREGRGHAFLTALPIPPRTSILAKMAVGYGMSFIGCLTAAVILAVMMPAQALPILLGFILAALFCYISGAITLNRDIAHPKLDWLTEQEAIKQNFGTLIGLLVSWGLLISLGVLSYFLLDWGFGMWEYFGCVGALLALAAYVSHRLLMKTADTKYCLAE